MPNRNLAMDLIRKVMQLRLPAEIERTFYRLYTEPDDYACFYAIPEEIRAACYRYEPIQPSDGEIRRQLEIMESYGLIHLYEVEGVPYLKIADPYFRPYQRRRAADPKYPLPLSTAGNRQRVPSADNICGYTGAESVTGAESESVTVTESVTESESDSIQGESRGGGTGEGTAEAPSDAAASESPGKQAGKAPKETNRKANGKGPTKGASPPSGTVEQLRAALEARGLDPPPISPKELVALTALTEAGLTVAQLAACWADYLGSYGDKFDRKHLSFKYLLDNNRALNWRRERGSTGNGVHGGDPGGNDGRWNASVGSAWNVGDASSG